MPEAPDSTVTDDEELVSAWEYDEEAVARLAARIAAADLDAESLELIMAALTAEACDHTEPAPA